MENYTTYITVSMAFLVSFLSVFILLPRFIRIMIRKNILDKPNHRASHVQATPSSGGIVFLPGLLLSAFLVNSATEYFVVLLLIVVLSIVGFWDDCKDLRATFRLFIQFAVSAGCYFSDLKISSLHGLAGIYEMPFYFELPLNLLLVTAIINSFNLIDGINGLASGLALISSLAFGSIFLYHGDMLFACIAFSLVGSLLVFLKFNFHRAQVFMGDAGSLLIGLCMAVFFMRVFQVENTFLSPMAVAVIIIPFLDMVKVFFLRINKGVSPFKADKTHIHHYFLKHGDSHRVAAVVIFLFQILLVLVAVVQVSINLDFHTSVALLIGIPMMFYAIIEMRSYRLLRKKEHALIDELKQTDTNNFLLNIR